MPGGLLAVDHREAVLHEEVHQGGEGALGGVGAPGEHRFAKEHAAQRDTVEAGDELRTGGVIVEGRRGRPGGGGFPDFERVGQAQGMQGRVGCDDGGSDPGAFLAGTGLGAGLHDAGEGGVEGDVPGGCAGGTSVQLPEQTAQGAGGREFAGEDDHPRVGGPPQDRLAAGVPREEAVAVGLDEAVWPEVGPQGDEARVTGDILVGGGQRGVGVYPVADHGAGRCVAGPGTNASKTRSGVFGNVRQRNVRQSRTFVGPLLLWRMLVMHGIPCTGGHGVLDHGALLATVRRPLCGWIRPGCCRRCPASQGGQPCLRSASCQHPVGAGAGMDETVIRVSHRPR